MTDYSGTELYYDLNAEDYFKSTVAVDIEPIRNSFLSRLKEGATILDFGCGSGRDSKAFLEQGFKVVSVDGSGKLCRLASEYIGQEVVQSSFQDYHTDVIFDGIWACASLLHLDIDDLKECLTYLSGRMADGGWMYVSFKYGTESCERDGRFYQDFTEESFKTTLEDIDDLQIIRTYTTDDYREDNDSVWLNVFLMKTEVTHDEMVVAGRKQIIPHRGMAIIPAFSSKKTLAIDHSIPRAEYAGALARLAQYADIGHSLAHIEKSVEYVVQIPLKYQKQFETGEYFINQNHTTGVEWPTLMRLTEKGQYRFVDDLPIKQQEFIQGNPMHELSMGFYNIAMQKQMAAIAEVVERTYKTVERIEHGQMDDRIALLNAGREGMILALTMSDEAEKMRAISLARNNLITAKNQIGNTLKRRAEEFELVPKTGIGRFFAEVKHSGYLSERDDEVDELQSYYELYLEATKLLAASYIVTGEVDAAQQAFIGGIGFMDAIDFTKVKSIEFAHKRANLSDMFYRQATPYLRAEQVQHEEETKEYEYISLEVSGQELLEALSNGRPEEI